MFSKNNLNDFDKSIIEELYKKHPIVHNDGIRDKLLPKINEWKRHISSYILSNNKYDNELSLLQKAEKSLNEDGVTLCLIENDYFDFKLFSEKENVKIDNNYWENSLDKLKKVPKLEGLIEKFSTNNVNKTDTVKEHNESLIIFRTNLQKQWRKLLEQEIVSWELQKTNELRRELLEQLAEWLTMMQALEDILSNLSLGHGLFFDLSEGDLTLTDLEEIKKWIEYISKDEGVKELCDLMGRIRRFEKSNRQELVKTTSIVHEYVTDTNSKEEIVGIMFGRDIEHVIPQELALLSDDETSILFDMKYIEGRLMCFDMEGFKQINQEIDEEIMTDVECDVKLGPIIICVDTSGSMSGTPESVAKAITLVMATRAISQNRSCYLINFSTSIETLDLSGGVGISKVIDFLQRSFHGGTDASPALEYALELMEKEDYKKSDLLMISDFLMNSLYESLYEKITISKENNNKFFSLTIGDEFLSKRLKSIFDNEWVFNPTNSSINSVRTMLDSI